MVKQKGFKFWTEKGWYKCDNCGAINVHPDCTKHLDGKDYCRGCWCMIIEGKYGKKMEDMIKV